MGLTACVRACARRAIASYDALISHLLRAPGVGTWPGHTRGCVTHALHPDLRPARRAWMATMATLCIHRPSAPPSTHKLFQPSMLPSASVASSASLDAHRCGPRYIDRSFEGVPTLPPNASLGQLTHNTISLRRRRQRCLRLVSARTHLYRRPRPGLRGFERTCHCLVRCASLLGPWTLTRLLSRSCLSAATASALRASTL